MHESQIAANAHIEKITKKYILDYLNALLFSNTVLWDGDDQYNELPIFYSSNETGLRIEQRGGLFVDKKTSKALRLSVAVLESATSKACYRISSLKEPYRIDEGNRLYYPLENAIVDVSVSDINLGSKDPSSYSFCDNTDETGAISNARLVALLRHVIGSAFLAIDDEELFKDLANDPLSYPPVPSDPHYKPVFGVKDVFDDSRD